MKYVYDQRSIGFGDQHGVTDAMLKRPKDKFKDWAWNSFAEEVCKDLNRTIDFHPDDFSVDSFAAKMRQKMAESRAKGRDGWYDKSQCSAETLSEMLRDHVEKGDPVDVANFSMMLCARGERIVGGR